MTTIKNKILFLIENSIDLNDTSKKMKELFVSESKRLDFKLSTEIKLRSSKRIMMDKYSEPLNSGQSEMTIEISFLEDKYYLFLENNSWVLNDEIREKNEIAKKLSKIKCLKAPSNLFDLKEYLHLGLLSFNQSLPIFSNKKINKEYDVISWDDANVLIGTNNSNTEIITHLEWENILSKTEY